MSTSSKSCARCGKAAELAPCYTRDDTGEMYHFQCIMINVSLEKPIALERKVNRLGEFQAILLDEQNKLRAAHNSPLLQWSATCENHAKKWVAYLLKLNENSTPDELQLQHDSYRGMGENLYLQSVVSTLPVKEAAKRITANWYSEEEEYDYNSNEYNHEASHFSQIVWKGTWKVGAACGQVGKVFVAVANFWPAGNIQGWFLDNVERKS